MTIMTLINIILVQFCGTLLGGLMLVCADGMFKYGKKPEWIRYTQAGFWTAGAIALFFFITSEWLANLTYTMSNTEVF